MLFMIIGNDDDRRKIERLFTKYNGLMFSSAFDILKDEYAAEDAVQQAFIKVSENLHSIDENNCRKTKNFLVIIVKNIAINMYNKRKKIKFVELEENLYDNGNTIENILIDNENLNRLSEIINSLKPIYKDVLIFRFSRNYSIQKIASLLEIEEKTVQKRIERAKKELLKRLCENKTRG